MQLHFLIHAPAHCQNFSYMHCAPAQSIFLICAPALWKFLKSAPALWTLLIGAPALSHSCTCTVKISHMCTCTVKNFSKFSILRVNFILFKFSVPTVCTSQLVTVSLVRISDIKITMFVICTVNAL